MVSAMSGFMSDRSPCHDEVGRLPISRLLRNAHRSKNRKKTDFSVHRAIRTVGLGGSFKRERKRQQARLTAHRSGKLYTDG